MGLGLNRKPTETSDGIWNIFGKGTNTSNKHNASHQAELPTNFNLAAITLESIDQGVYQEFNNRFVIGDKNMVLFSGDAETTSLPMMNFESFDQGKGFLNWPFFVFTRTETNKVLRTSPTFKQVLFAVPKMKAQGIVIEEYLSEGPINYELIYDFKFITYFREEANQMEQQMNHYFRGKRNIIEICKERFSVGPAQQQLCTLDMVNRDEAAQMTMYVLTMKLKVWCWTRRGSEDMQKRERPNSYSFEFIIKDKGKKNNNTAANAINVEEFVIVNTPKPTDIIDPT